MPSVARHSLLAICRLLLVLCPAVLCSLLVVVRFLPSFSSFMSALLCACIRLLRVDVFFCLCSCLALVFRVFFRPASFVHSVILVRNLTCRSLIHGPTRSRYLCYLVIAI